jgi:hypothetical protein
MLLSVEGEIESALLFPHEVRQMVISRTMEASRKSSLLHLAVEHVFFPQKQGLGVQDLRCVIAQEEPEILNASILFEAHFLNNERRVFHVEITVLVTPADHVPTQGVHPDVLVEGSNDVPVNHLRTLVEPATFLVYENETRRSVLIVHEQLLV